MAARRSGMDTARLFALYESMSLPELVDRLEDIDGNRTPVGWTSGEATHRVSLERRIVDLVTRQRGAVGPTVRCHLAITLRSGNRKAAGLVRELGAGGVFVETEPGWMIGNEVEMQVQAASDEYGLKVRAAIRAVERGRLRVSFGEQRTEGEERRIRRFVLEVVRNRTEWSTPVS